MAKRSGPRDPDDAIPVEFIRGREDPDGSGDGDTLPAPPQQPPQLPPAPRSAPADRAIIVAVIAAVVAGGAAYAFRKEIADQYERRVHPERYWSAQVKSRQFSIALGELEHQECMVDLRAARMKESINAARSELLGFTSSEARAWAAEATAAQEQVCDFIADNLRADRERLSAAERELVVVRSK